ncbi:MAG: AI-2E family transporter [Actinobacteria bacterium]|nr:AI-2E family transporter [Actinomycetota bacterium]
MNEIKKSVPFIEKYKNFGIAVWTTLGILLLFSCIFLSIYGLRAVLPPFIYAAALVYMLRPLVDFIEDRGLSRLFALFLTYILLILIVIVIMLFIVPKVIDEFNQLTKEFPRYIKVSQKLVSDYQWRLKKFRIPSEANKLIAEALSKIKDPLVRSFAKVPETLIDLFGKLFNFILAPIIAFYALKDLQEIKDSFLGLISPKYRDEALDVLRKVDLVLGGFVRGQLTIAVIFGVLSSIFLTLLGVDFAILIGMLAGFLNLIPYIGPIFAAIPAIVVILFKSSTIVLIEVLIIFFVLNQIINFIIYPLVMKHHIGLHPILLIFSLLAGGMLFGFFGLFLAIPTVAVIKALIDHFLTRESY